MWKGGGGWGAGTPYGRMYNPRTVETIRGEVVSVDQITPMKGRDHGVHTVGKTDKKTISVHFGPGWYIENQDVKIAPKDKIEGEGSRIMFEGKAAVIAAEVKKGDDVSAANNGLKLTAPLPKFLRPRSLARALGVNGERHYE